MGERKQHRLAKAIRECDIYNHHPSKTALEQDRYDKATAPPAKKKRSLVQTQTQSKDSSNIMTHPIYSRSILETFSLKDLKAIANQLGTAPVVDKRYKATWITCILRKQGNLTKADFTTVSGASLVQQPSEVVVEIETLVQPVTPQTEAQFETKCKEQALKTVKTKSPTVLKIYCDTHNIVQSSWFEILKGVFDSVFYGFSGTASPHQESIIVDAIRTQESKSEACCDVLEIELIDLELEYGDVVIPPGVPSIEIYQSKQLLGLLTKHPLHGTYHAHKRAVGYDDLYSAALSFFSPYDVESARK